MKIKTLILFAVTTICTIITSNLPDTVSAQNYNGRKERTNKTVKEGTKQGNRFIEVIQSDPDGNDITLSQVIKDNEYVLIDFWASWCGPCLMEIPYLVEAHNEYAEKGFDIYGISLDYQRDSWVDAINRNGMDWIHVSDLSFWENAAAIKYKIRAIPSNFLVDKNGIIVASNLRGESLKQTLSKLLD